MSPATPYSLTRSFWRRGLLRKPQTLRYCEQSGDDQSIILHSSASSPHNHPQLWRKQVIAFFLFPVIHLFSQHSYRSVLFTDSRSQPTLLYNLLQRLIPGFLTLECTTHIVLLKSLMAFFYFLVLHYKREDIPFF